MWRWQVWRRPQLKIILINIRTTRTSFKRHFVQSFKVIYRHTARRLPIIASSGNTYLTIYREFGYWLFTGTSLPGHSACLRVSLRNWKLVGGHLSPELREQGWIVSFFCATIRRLGEYSYTEEMYYVIAKILIINNNSDIIIRVYGFET